MNEFEGKYYSGQHPVAVSANLNFDSSEISLTTDTLKATYSVTQLSVSPRIGTTMRFINLPNSGQIACLDNCFLDQLPQESHTEGIVAWLEQRLYIAFFCVAMVLTILLVGYFIGLPAASKHIATKLPMETERVLGIETLTYLENHSWFQGSSISHDRQDEIRIGFKLLIQDLPFKDQYELNFRSSGVFGPNALAFPGGIIIITDEMVELAENNEEIYAVLAHEIGHVELRHTLRSIMQNSAIGVIAATVTSDAATLSGAMVGLPIIVAQTKYSREFESEADRFAFQLLTLKGFSPHAFADLMERLSSKHRYRMKGFAWISTHPVTSERIEQAREASNMGGTNGNGPGKSIEIYRDTHH